MQPQGPSRLQLHVLNLTQENKISRPRPIFQMKEKEIWGEQTFVSRRNLNRRPTSPKATVPNPATVTPVTHLYLPIKKNIFSLNTKIEKF
jgi:hypothetical protein